MGCRPATTWVRTWGVAVLWEGCNRPDFHPNVFSGLDAERIGQLRMGDFEACIKDIDLPRPPRGLSESPFVRCRCATACDQGRGKRLRCSRRMARLMAFVARQGGIPGFARPTQTPTFRLRPCLRRLGQALHRGWLWFAAQATATPGFVSWVSPTDLLDDAPGAGVSQVPAFSGELLAPAVLEGWLD